MNGFVRKIRLKMRLANVALLPYEKTCNPTGVLPLEQIKF
jgi:hypothetical protein